MRSGKTKLSWEEFAEERFGWTEIPLESCQRVRECVFSTGWWTQRSRRIDTIGGSDINLIDNYSFQGWFRIVKVELHFWADSFDCAFPHNRRCEEKNCIPEHLCLVFCLISQYKDFIIFFQFLIERQIENEMNE